mmetsp:Transcript_4218/g.6435  ORF Transcript_4218/g.6435 Transcript_4218/m.6435 type:complete len:245 (-) Transcript_4218:210-944(-)
MSFLRSSTGACFDKMFSGYNCHWMTSISNSFTHWIEAFFNLRITHNTVVSNFVLGVDSRLHKHAPMQVVCDAMSKNISLESVLHIVINEPAVPLDFIHNSLVSPFEEVEKRRSLGVEVIEVFVGCFPGFSVADVPQNIVVLNKGSSHISYDHDNLIADVLPAPNAFMMRVVRLDKRFVAHPQELKIPLVLRSPTCQRLHLNKCKSLITTGKSCNDCLEECDVFVRVVRLLGRRMVASPKTEGSQ